MREDLTRSRLSPDDKGVERGADAGWTNEILYHSGFLLF
jgi:hypothetical protein